MRMAQRAFPARADVINFADAQAIRDEIARAVPAYDGIQRLTKAGDQVQWGGSRLCEIQDETGASRPHFPTESGRAKFSIIAINSEDVGDKLRLSTRRGKQFNSMVHKETDPLTGARRDDVFMNETDVKRLGLADGDPVVLTSATGDMRGRCRVAPIAPGNVQVHWPEGNVLIERGVSDPECGIPDYNALVEVKSVDGPQAD